VRTENPRVGGSSPPPGIVPISTVDSFYLLNVCIVSVVFMALGSETLMTIVRSGGHLDLSNCSYSASTIEALLEAANKSGAHITVSDKSLSGSTLKRLAELGENSLTVKVTE